ncbi:MarR family winged helix-turn-helix transcriptional regulator [Lentzea jiangxiensis]|uniref:DNA-binding transcriptional regulator, MarR family n=1 Tax=Lentzea jiangxiensis TaxID=641025 RepID=A0A1H0LI23_9PSEU|nr:MarR family transcriptional regulator [Lentzea jiangxiensis]SDO67590.1 DNA-binding transcriptional regulator, MarR family [Lentzea jiangxiensis]
MLQVLTQVVEQIEVMWERSKDASPAPLSVSQLRVMFVLEHSEGANLRALGEALDAAPSSVSRLCDRLQAVGFLDRGLSTTSRREVVLALSDRGRAYLQELRDRRREHLRDVVDALPPSARSTLVSGLRRLRDAASSVHPLDDEQDTTGTQTA